MKHLIYIAYLIAYVFIGSFANAQTDTTLTFAPGIYKEALFLRDDTIIFNRIDDSTSTVFNDTIKLLNCHFPKRAQFRIDTFNSNVYFNKYSDDDTSVFYDSVDFYKTLFKGKACFQRSKFLGKANFRRIHVNGKAYFEGSQYFDTTFFRLAHFYNEVRFQLNTFHSHVDFSKAIFDGLTRFENSFFKSTVLFDSITINTPIYFNNARFNGDLIFKDLKTKHEDAKLVFVNTILPDTLIFYYNISLISTIDLRFANFYDSVHYTEKDKTSTYKKHNLVLYKSNISMFRFDYDHFNFLMIKPKNKDTFDNKWEALNYKEACSLYDALLFNFNQFNSSEDIKQLTIEYLNYQRKNDPIILKKLGLSTLYIWNQYGYAKEWVIKWTGIFLLIFTLTTTLIFNHLTQKVYPPERKFKKNNGRISALWKVWYSFIYVSSIFFFFNFRFKDLRSKYILSVIYIALIYTTGAICIAYFADYVLQK